AASGSLLPLTWIRGSAIGASLLCRSRRLKALEPERLDRRLDHIIKHQPRDRIRCHRSEQNAIAVMAGGVDQTLGRTRPEDRRVIAASGAVADPYFGDRQLLDRGYGAPGRFEQCQHAA